MKGPPFPRGDNYKIGKIHWQILKNLLLQNHWVNFNQTWHKASSPPELLGQFYNIYDQNYAQMNSLIWTGFSGERCGPWASFENTGVFHMYRDITFAGESLQNWSLCSALMIFDLLRSYGLWFARHFEHGGIVVNFWYIFNHYRNHGFFLPKWLMYFKREIMNE